METIVYYSDFRKSSGLCFEKGVLLVDAYDKNLNYKGTYPVSRFIKN